MYVAVSAPLTPFTTVAARGAPALQAIERLLRRHPFSMLQVRAVCELPRGQELCISYIELCSSTAERQQVLRKRYGFECDCEKCVNEEQWARRLRPRRS